MKEGIEQDEDTTDVVTVGVVVEVAEEVIEIEKEGVVVVVVVVRPGTPS